MIAMSFQKQEIPHATSRVNTPLQLAATPSALGALALAFCLMPWRRRLDHRGCCQKVRRQLHVGANGPDQHLVIFGATVLGCEPPDERQGVFGAQIDLLEILKKFEVSKHHGFHLKGYRMSGVGIRGRI
jgi:hypothetical protein